MQGSPYNYKGFVGGDFILSEAAPPIITREAVLLPSIAASGTAITYQPGFPFSFTQQSAAGAPSLATAIVGSSTESSTKGLLTEKITVLPGQSGVPASLLARGPAAIDFAALPTADVSSPTPVSFVAATLKTAIIALGIEIRYEGVTQTEQVS